MRQTTAPTTAVSLKVTNDTHYLPPLLTIQNFLYPWLVYGAYLVGGPDSHPQGVQSPFQEWLLLIYY